MTITEYPIKPFDGMKYTDQYGREWIYNADKKSWVFNGLSTRIPVADSSTIGFLSAELKTTIDSLPDKAGGFGVITKFDKTNTGASGFNDILTGFINIKSESFEIICRDGKGKPIVEECKNLNYSPELDNAPSIDINFSENLLDTFCLEIPGGPGPKGNKGDKGPKGADGTGDGPQGLVGDNGIDAEGISEISGIRIEESDDFYSQAVISLDLDSETSKLYVTKGNVAVADSETPADKFVVQPIFRSLEWGDDFDFTIIKSDADTTSSAADCVLLSYPSDFNPGVSDPDSVQASRYNLSQYVTKVIGLYQEKLAEYIAEYDEEIKAFILAKDEEARKMMDVLVKELANLDFNDTFEYCMSLQDNGTCGQQVANQLKVLNEVTLKAIGQQLAAAIAAIQNTTFRVFTTEVDPNPGGDAYAPIYPDFVPTNNYNPSLCRFTQEVLMASGYDSASASDFCAGSRDTQIGTITVDVTGPAYVNSPSSYLSAGAYVFQYTGGFMFDGSNSACGYIVGTNSIHSGLVLVLETDDTLQKFPWPKSSVSHNALIPDEVENAYLSGPLNQQAKAIIIPVGVQAKIYIELATEDKSISFGEVTLRITNCEKC